MRWLAFVILLAALLASAVGVVAMRHEARQQFVALQQAEAARDEQQVEWSRLQLEQAWLAESGRIERAARERLDMQSPDHVGVLVEGR
ncbi:cell division protein FtsL [Wenzhouxiangella sp. AB-CW3]|nr:cell division protein FtsL [Wenzhouxiangella sp. AB-CW3]